MSISQRLVGSVKILISVTIQYIDLIYPQVVTTQYIDLIHPQVVTTEPNIEYAFAVEAVNVQGSSGFTQEKRISLTGLFFIRYVINFQEQWDFVH